MRKLKKANINTPELSDNIFLERWRGMAHWCDISRFRLLAHKFKGGRYLDIGAFNSPMPFELALAYGSRAEIHALDWAPEVCATMAKAFPEVSYHCLPTETLSTAFPPASFDYVVAGELIEHLDDPEGFIKDAMAIVKPGGILAVSTPLDDVGNITDEHVWSFSKQDILDMLSPFGKVTLIVEHDSFPTIVAYCTKT